MKTATQTMDAASSTPPASPAGSTPAQESGAITEITSADVAEALGLHSEGEETDAADGADDGEQSDGAETDAGEDAGGPESEAGAEGDDEGAADGATDESVEGAGEGEAAAETGESDTTEEADEPAQPEKPAKNPELQKRIDELTARGKTAESEAAALREKLATYQARDAGALDESALETVDTREELAANRSRYVKLHKWAMSNPDGGKMPDGKGGETEFTREEVAHIQAQTFGLLNESVPQREQYLAHRDEADAAALQSYPWLADKAKGDGLAVQKAIEALPFMRRLPNHRLVAANAYVGEKLRRAGITVDDALIARLAKEQKGRGTKPAGNGAASAAPHRPAPPPRAPAAPGRAGSLPPRRTPAAAQDRAAQRKLSASSGSVDDLAASIAAKLQPSARR